MTGTDGDRVFRRSRLLLVFLAASLGSTAVATAQSAGRFTPTGTMTAPRAEHSATLLPDGRVLIAGGESSNPSILASVEIYDPDAGTFRAAGSMITARRMHTATLLPDDRILIVGGYGASG